MSGPRATGDTLALGAALRAARDQSGLSLNEASIRLRDVLPQGQLWKTGETIRQYELGRFNPDDAVCAIVLLGLAKVYQAEFHHVTDANRRDFEQLADLIKSRCFGAALAQATSGLRATA